MNQYMFFERVKATFTCFKMRREARRIARQKRRELKIREVEREASRMLAIKKREWRIIHRDNDVKRLMKAIKTNPERFIFLYGPPMVGKSMLLKQFFRHAQREKRTVRIYRPLFGKPCEKKASAFHPKYFNFRSFLIKNVDDLKGVLVNTELPFDEEAKNRILSGNNPFYAFEQEMKRIYETKGSRVLLLVEEVQLLERAVVDDKKNPIPILEAFLNFLIRIGTETDYGRVVMTTPQKFFVQKFYQDPLFRERGAFLRIDHLSYKETKKFLEGYYPNMEEAILKRIWDVLGGAIPDLWKFIMRDWEVKVEEKGFKGWLAKKLQKREGLSFTDVEAYLDSEIKRTFRELKKIIIRELKEDEMGILFQIIEEINKRGKYNVTLDKKSDLEVIDKLVHQNILFFDPIELTVQGSKRLNEKALIYMYKNFN